jgi:molybdopterin-guanine dinucleotide biosynthesis protein MobB
MEPEKAFVTVLGYSSTGKTTLITAALRACVRRGVKASAAKCVRHDYDVAPSGKDSTLFLEAGASASLFVGRSRAVLYEAAPEERDKAFFSARLPDSEIVFLEGALVDGALRVLTAGDAKKESDLKLRLCDIDILATDDPGLIAAASAAGKAVIAPGDGDALVDMVEVRHGT